MKVITVAEYLPLIHNNYAEIIQEKFDLGEFLETHGYERDLSRIRIDTFNDYIETLSEASYDKNSEVYAIDLLFDSSAIEYTVAPDIYSGKTRLTKSELLSYIEQMTYNKTLHLCKLSEDSSDGQPITYLYCNIKSCELRNNNLSFDHCTLADVTLSPSTPNGTHSFSNTTANEITISGLSSLQVTNCSFINSTITGNIFTNSVKIIECEFLNTSVIKNSFDDLTLYKVYGLVANEFAKNMFCNIGSCINLSANGWDYEINRTKVELATGPVMAISYSWNSSMTMDILIEGLRSVAMPHKIYDNQIIYMDNTADFEAVISTMPSDHIDMVILPGGENVPVSYYNPRRNYRETSVEIPKIHPRTAFELNLLRWADRTNVPVIGICRGLQVMGVWAGLALTNITDVPTHAELASMVVKQKNKGLNPLYKLCRDLSHSKLAKNPYLKYDPNRESFSIKIKCVHSQCLQNDNLDESNIEVLGLSPDGTIEFARFRSEFGTLLLGMQNHPEKVVTHNFVAEETIKMILDIAKTKQELLPSKKLMSC